MSSPEIRTAALSDVAAIGEVFRRSSLSNEGERAVLLAHPEALIFDDVAVREGRTRVAIEAGRIVGFATMRPSGPGVAELDDLFVDPDHVRRGVARLLIADAVAIAEAQGCTRIVVTANTHALAFYRAVGFVLDGTTATRFGPAPRMHLDLPPAAPR